jgi:ribosome-binding ATPase
MFSVGLVGLPNAGKSTLFNLITKRTVPAENFPFCTIDPHDGIVSVPDFRVKELAKLNNSQKEIYAAIEFRDIAGLVKGAHQGAGLGNQFLSHIREVDLILLVVRAFENDDIIHVENRVNPIEDEEILMLELMMADQNVLEKTIQRLEKDLRGASKDPLAMEKMTLAEKLLTSVSELQPARLVTYLTEFEKDISKWRKSLNLLTDKPVVKLANVSMDNPNVPYNSDFQMDIASEAAVGDLSVEERVELGMEEQSGLDKLIKVCYDKLNLATFLTAGEIESRAWTFVNGMTAPECAGKIHTDFEKKFIKAELISYEDYMACKGRKGAIEQGKMQMVGKEHLMQDGDVVEFKIGG